MIDRETFEIYPEAPFAEYYRADVYISPKYNRRMIIMYKSGGGRLRTTYGRYLFQVDYWNKYKILIPDELEVDHINEDKLDDRLENFQLLTHKENVIKNNFSKGSMYNFCTCPICGSTFIKAQHMTTPYTINLCSNLCLKTFRISKISQNLSKYLSIHQTILTFRLYRHFPSGDEYRCELVNKFDDCFYPRILINAHEWLSKTLLKEFVYVDPSERSKDIVEMRDRGFSYRKIGRLFNVDKNSIRRMMTSIEK